MRKLSSGNKMNFTMFSFIVFVIIVIMIGALLKGLQNVKEVYPVTRNICVYDSKYNYVNLENDGEISKKWNNNYYLKENESKKEYDLGKYSVAYNETKKSLDLFGNFYQVLKGGNVEKLTDHNIIKSTQDSKFYKIEDRKYLIVGRVIKNNSETLSTYNYLIVILDKSGNALLLNDSINLKTINQIIISTDAFKFDVANEKLIMNEEEINLKKIIGSTNEYVNNVKDSSEENQTQNNLEPNNTEENKQIDTQITTASETTIEKTEIQNNQETRIIDNNAESKNIENQNEQNNLNDIDKKDSNNDINENIVENNENDNKSKENNTVNQANLSNTTNNNIGNENNTENTTNINIVNEGNTSNTTNNNSTNTTNNNTSNETNTSTNTTNNTQEDTDSNSWVDMLNEWINSVASGFKSLYNKDKNKKQDTSLTRSIALNRVSASTSYIDIDYTITDPENKYNVVYVTISNDTETQSISLNKDATSYRVTGLKPNKDYTVQMGYKIIYSSSETEENIEDTMNIRTKTPNESLKITKVSTDKVYYTLKLDNNFMYDDNCKIVVYLNDETTYLTVDLNNRILSKAGSSGYLGSFVLPKEYKIKGSSLKIVLEDTKVDGVTIDTNLMAKIVNY